MAQSKYDVTWLCGLVLTTFLFSATSSDMCDYAKEWCRSSYSKFLFLGQLCWWYKNILKLFLSYTSEMLYSVHDYGNSFLGEESSASTYPLETTSDSSRYKWSERKVLLLLKISSIIALRWMMNAGGCKESISCRFLWDSKLCSSVESSVLKIH